MSLLWAVAVRELARADSCDSLVVLPITCVSNCGPILITAAEFLLAPSSRAVVDDVVGIDPWGHR